MQAEQTPPDQRDFEKKQQEFYDNYGQSFEQISSQTIHSSFHPKTYQSQGDSKVIYIVKLDQFTYPANSQIIQMGTQAAFAQRESPSQSYGFGAKEVQIKHKGYSINQNLIEEEDGLVEEIKQVHFSNPSQKTDEKSVDNPSSVKFQNSHRTYDSQSKLEVNKSYLKNDIDENNDLIHGSDRSSSVTKQDQTEKTMALKKQQLEKNQHMYHKSTSGKMIQLHISGQKNRQFNYIRRSLNQKSINSVVAQNQVQAVKSHQQTQEDDDKSHIFSDPYPLYQKEVAIDQKEQNYYELSIWGCEEGIKADQCLAFQRFSVGKQNTIYKDSFFFSVDGNHLFLISQDEKDSKLTEVLIFLTTDLQPYSPNHTINITKANIYAQKLNSDPQLIPATETTPIMISIEAGQTMTIIQSDGKIGLQLEQEIESSKIGETSGIIRHVGFKRVRSNSSYPHLEVIMLLENQRSSSKYRFKAYHLALDDFMLLKQKQNINMPFFRQKALNKVNITFKAKKDLNNCFFKALWQPESHLLMISIQHNVVGEFDSEMVEKDETSHLILASSKEKNIQFSAQLQSRYYRSQNLQFCQDPVLIIFNEKLNSYVGLTVEIIMTSFRNNSIIQDSFLECLNLSHIDSHKIIKIKTEENLSFNCFDILITPSKRDYSLLSYDFVEDKRILFTQNSKGTKHFLKTSESVYLNPYFVTVDNQSLLNIYSIHSNSRVIVQYQLCRQTSFLKFVEMYHGSITISDSMRRRKEIYRHQALFFLSKTSELGSFNDVGSGLAKLNLECIEMPKYDKLSEKLETEDLLIDKRQALGFTDSNFQLYQLKGDINLDINLNKNRNIIRCIIGSIHIKGKSKGITDSLQNYLVIQSSKQFIIQQLGKDLGVKYYPFGNNIEVPMCISRLSETEGSDHRETLNIIYLKTIDQQYELNMLRIRQNQNNEIESLNLCKLPKAKYFQIQSFNDHVLLFNTSTPEVTKFIYVSRTKTLKNVEAFQFVDELKHLIESYNKSQLEIRSVLTLEGIYIGPSYFQYLNVNAQDYEDIEDFEEKRVKEVGNGMIKHLISEGPYLSQDSTRLFYQVTNLDQPEKCQETAASFSLLRLQTEIPVSISMIFSKATNKMTRTKTLISKSQDMQFSNNAPSLAGASQVGQELQQNMNGAMKTDSFKTLAFEIPLFEKKEFHILPQDNYLCESLKFSTYAIDDLILIYLNQSFLLFTKYGKSKALIVEPQLAKLLESNGQNLKLVQIKSINEATALAILMEDQKKYYALTLTKYGIKIKLSLNEEDCIVKVKNDQVVFQDAKFDIFGKLYHIIIQESKQKNLEVQICERGKPIKKYLEELSRELNDIRSGQSQSQSDHSDIEHQKHSNVSNSHDAGNYNDESKKALLDNSHLDHEYDGKDHDHSQSDFIFEILHDQYLVIKMAKTIMFTDLRKTQNLQIQKVDLQLDGEIVSLHQTQAIYLLQFVYRASPKQDHLALIFTWDLNLNLEHNVQKIKCNRSANQIYKSTKEQLNFYVPKDKDVIFDIRYEFPVNYFSGTISNCSNFYRKNENKVENAQELKICSLHESLLGICREKLASIQLSFSVINLQYMQYMCERLISVKNALDFESPPLALLKYLQFSHESKNPLHLLALDHTFLELYSVMVKEKVASGFSKQGLDMVSYVVMQDSQFQTPFSISMESKTLKSIELMLEILCQNTNSGYDYFFHMKKYFIQLIETKSSIFFQFFDQSCTEKLCLRLKTTKYDFAMKPYNIMHNTRLMNKKFFLEKLSVSADQEMKIGHGQTIQGMKNLQSSVSKAEECLFKDPSHFEQKKNLKNDVQPVQATIFDYGWLLRGQAGSEFIDYLAHQSAESPIFKLKNIETIVNAQWKPFRSLYVKWIFIPFCIYLVSTILFNSIMNEHIFSLSRLMQYEQDPSAYIFDNIRLPAGVLMVLFAVYFLIIEFLKMKFVEYRTKSDVSIYLMIFFHLLNLITYILDIYEAQDKTYQEFIGKLDPYIVFSSVSVMCAYFVLLIHLKIYRPFAFYINLIFVCLKDSFVYNIILSIGGLAFANAMFILAMIEKPDTSYDKITGVNLFTGILYQVKGYLYQEPAGIKLKNKYVFGIIYMLYTLIITQIMLKVLINLLHHFYEQAMETYDQERLRTQCCLIRENEYFFGRQELFKKVKYVIRFYAEQVNQISENQGHSGKHGQVHEANHSGANHAPVLYLNPHYGHNHSQRAGAHHGATESHHSNDVEYEHDHHPHSGAKHEVKNGVHKKNKDDGIETILTSIQALQARFDSIEASFNKK